jgi:hypothetical protein
MSAPPIEVYEWADGEPHPRETGRSLSGFVIGIVEIPPDGMIPQVGDVVTFTEIQTRGTNRGRVRERHFEWVSVEGGAPQRFAAMWLFVSRF